MGRFRKTLKALTWAVLALTSAACAHTTPPAIQPAPVRVDPRLCAPLEPEPDPAGSLVRPITQEEIDGFDRFLDAELGVRLWGRGMATRATIAKRDFCR